MKLILTIKNLSEADIDYIKFWGSLQFIWITASYILIDAKVLFIIVVLGPLWMYWLSAWRDEKEKSFRYFRNGVLIYEVNNDYA